MLLLSYTNVASKLYLEVEIVFFQTKYFINWTLMAILWQKKGNL